eukprot:5426444-Pyramimonas_sp.AAC.2
MKLLWVYLFSPYIERCCFCENERFATVTEDDTEELMKELERIKKERAEEANRKQVRDMATPNASIKVSSA